jgi:hypothetical protein
MIPPMPVWRSQKNSTAFFVNKNTNWLLRYNEQPIHFQNAARGEAIARRSMPKAVGIDNRPGHGHLPFSL